MATQALTMATNPSKPALPASHPSGYRDPLPVPLLKSSVCCSSSAAVANTPTTSDERNIQAVPNTSAVLERQIKNTEPIRRRQSSLDRVILRKHKYENLTMLLNTPQAIGLLRSNSPNSYNIKDTSCESAMLTNATASAAICTAKVTAVTGMTATSSPTAAIAVSVPLASEVLHPELPKLCLSPRFPPDGAAFYETSPPNSSVSTSPVTSSNPELKSNLAGPTSPLGTSEATSATRTAWATEAAWKAQQQKEQQQIAPSCAANVQSSLDTTSCSANEFQFVPSTGTNGPNTPNRTSVGESAALPTATSGMSNHLSSVVGTGTNVQPDWFPPAPPPPLQINRDNDRLTNGSPGPRYQQHCRPGEESLHGFGAAHVAVHLKPSNPGADHPLSAPATCAISNVLTSNPLLSPRVDRTVSSPTPPPLPPPPPPPSPPAVPRRDPKTMLHQPQRKQTAISDTGSDSAGRPHAVAELCRPNVISSTAEGPKQIDMDDISNPVTDRKRSVVSTVKDFRTVPGSERSADQVRNPPVPAGSSLTDAGSQPTTCTQVSRPISLKGSPTVTDGVVDYQRHHGSPICTTTTAILDGRSVVPWKPTSRDLIPTADTDSSVQAAVAAALSQSVAFPDDSPQWVPPKHTANSIVLAPTSEYVGTVPVDDRVTEVPPTNPRRVTATRPTYLTTSPGTGSDPRQIPERVRQQSNRRLMSESSVSHNRRDPGRRNRTTSDMDALHLLAEMGHPGLGQQQQHQPQLFDGSGSSEAAGINNISPTEADWWRAQQRSGLALYGQSRTRELPEMFRRQISAGPAFNLTPTQLSPTRVPAPQQHVMARSREMAHLVGRTKSSPSDHARVLVAQSATCGQFNEAVVLDDPNTIDLLDPSRFSCPRPMLSLSPEHPRYFADPRFIAVDQPHRTSLDRGHPSRLHESFESDLRERLPRDSYGPPCPAPSMTQSVFFPPDSSWVASGPHPFDGTQAAPAPSTTASASGRRRRVRTSVTRSQSQRTTDLFDPRLVGSVTIPETQGCSFSPAFYQRSVSHTVPLEAMGPEAVWPPVLAQWHHRRPMACDPVVFTSQSGEFGVTKKERSLRAGRSSNDLIHLNRKKHGHPHHHHSASAIYECLEEQPWFHFDLSRSGAERLLKTAPVGSFLVRQSETSKSEYSLSVRRECDFLHMKISLDPNSNQYVLGEYSQPYPTVSAMICRYMQSLLPVRGTTPVLLRFPVCRSSPSHKNDSIIS